VGPLVDWLAGPAQVFGVSGYSGAGKRPSERNDFMRLKGGVLPYKLTGHVHEAEASRHLGHPVRFMPHVAPYYRGISLTVSLSFREPARVEEVRARFVEAYEREPLVAVFDAIPRVQEIAGKHGVAIGGISVSEDGLDCVLVATLDNLLKGAATQALQNLNLACGLDELDGVWQWLD
jgi:N-acetyl-gamma-glutamyl-phosphate reductase